MKESQVHSYQGPREMRALKMEKDQVGASFDSLGLIGIGLDGRTVGQMMEGFGEDAIQGLVTTPSIGTPVQFLQNWLPGFVHVITAARKIDELVGMTTAGAWEDEEVIQAVLEPTGKSVPYGDHTNIPLSSYNTNFERRTVVRFEEGMHVGSLEEARAGRMNLNSGAAKREAAAISLEVQRNAVGFYGFNNGDGRTYGFLNDPGLPAYVTVAATGTGSSPLWSTKTFLNITADIRAAVAALRAQSQDTIDPESVPLTLAIASNRVDFLSVTSDYGNSVREWIKETYPKMRIVSAPELSGANGGASVFYLYAERVSDSSTDGGRVFDQIVPAKFKILGVEKRAKGYLEDYSNASAGIMVKRPYAVVRRSGI